MFLMPSLYEPCGLNQMYSLSTAPCRSCGGREDSRTPVEPTNPSTGAGNGFVFEHYTPEALAGRSELALDGLSRSGPWLSIVLAGMNRRLLVGETGRGVLLALRSSRAHGKEWRMNVGLRRALLPPEPDALRARARPRTAGQRPWNRGATVPSPSKRKPRDRWSITRGSDRSATRTALLRADPPRPGREWITVSSRPWRPTSCPTARVREACRDPRHVGAHRVSCRDKPAMKEPPSGGNPCAAVDGCVLGREVRVFASAVGIPLIVKPRDAAGASGNEPRGNWDGARATPVPAGGLRSGVPPSRSRSSSRGTKASTTPSRSGGHVAHEFVTHYYPNVLEANAHPVDLAPIPSRRTGSTRRRGMPS
jgi:hypothetical protein